MRIIFCHTSFISRLNATPVSPILLLCLWPFSHQMLSCFIKSETNTFFFLIQPINQISITKTLIRNVASIKLLARLVNHSVVYTSVFFYSSFKVHGNFNQNHLFWSTRKCVDVQPQLTFLCDFSWFCWTSKFFRVPASRTSLHSLTPYNIAVAGQVSCRSPTHSNVRDFTLRVLIVCFVYSRNKNGKVKL